MPHDFYLQLVEKLTDEMRRQGSEVERPCHGCIIVDNRERHAEHQRTMLIYANLPIFEIENIMFNYHIDNVVFLYKPQQISKKALQNIAIDNDMFFITQAIPEFEALPRDTALTHFIEWPEKKPQSWTSKILSCTFDTLMTLLPHILDGTCTYFAHRMF